MYSPKISIVTPTYNRVDSLKKTVDCIFKQTYKNIEYIIINDGSVDGTEEYLETIKHEAVILNRENSGQVNTLNHGWELSSGEYITYLSDDDILYPQAIEKLMQEIVSNPDVACVYPDANLIDINDVLVRKNVCKETIYEDLIIKQHCFIGPGAIFRKDHYLQVGRWNSEYLIAPDREFWMRLGLLGQIKFHKEVLSDYRIHSDSGSVKNINEIRMQEYICVLDDYFNRPGIPVCISDRKNEAYSNAYLLIASACLNGWAFWQAILYVKKSFQFDSKNITFKNLYVLIRSGFSPHVRKLLWKLGVSK